MRADMGYCEARSQALHRFCARHLSENVKKSFDKRASELFEAAAYTKGVQRHHDALDLLKEQLGVHGTTWTTSEKPKPERRGRRPPPERFVGMQS